MSRPTLFEGDTDTGTGSDGQTDVEIEGRPTHPHATDEAVFLGKLPMAVALLMNTQTSGPWIMPASCGSCASCGRTRREGTARRAHCSRSLLAGIDTSFSPAPDEYNVVWKCPRHWGDNPVRLSSDYQKKTRQISVILD